MAKSIDISAYNVLFVNSFRVFNPALENVNDIDGVKISFESRRRWVHLRKSNTEPIIRIYSEAPTEEDAVKLGEEVIGVAKKIING